VATKQDEFNELSGDIKPMLNQLGFRLVESGWASVNNSMVLRFVVDKVHKTDYRDGVTHGNCIQITKTIETEMEKRRFFDDIDYSIEVSSPGVSRAFTSIEDYEANLGIEIVVKLREKIEGHDTIAGFLRQISSDGTSVTVEITGYENGRAVKPKGPKKVVSTTGKTVSIALDNIIKSMVKLQF